MPKLFNDKNEFNEWFDFSKFDSNFSQEND
jgi:hypothetical protein